LILQSTLAENAIFLLQMFHHDKPDIQPKMWIIYGMTYDEPFSFPWSHQILPMIVEVVDMLHWGVRKHKIILLLVFVLEDTNL
jgi:hypothetical protein